MKSLIKLTTQEGETYFTTSYLLTNLNNSYIIRPSVVATATLWIKRLIPICFCSLTEWGLCSILNCFTNTYNTSLAMIYDLYQYVNKFNLTFILLHRKYFRFASEINYTKYNLRYFL